MAFNGWTDYAILQASAGGKQWKVQINGEGQFRCNCPAFIFCKGTKTCKHCRRCEEQRQKEQTIATPIAQAVAQAKSLQRIEAEKVFDAMCAAASQKTYVNVKATIGATGGAAMVDVLMARLATWMPPAAASAVAETAVVGVRRITFDD
jgi:hypothetical protein